MDNKAWYELLVKILREDEEEGYLEDSDTRATVEIGLSHTGNSLESIRKYDENTDYKKVYLCLYYETVYSEEKVLDFSLFEGLINTDNREYAVVSLDFEEYLAKLNEIAPDD